MFRWLRERRQKRKQEEAQERRAHLREKATTGRAAGARKQLSYYAGDTDTLKDTVNSGLLDQLATLPTHKTVPMTDSMMRHSARSSHHDTDPASHHSSHSSHDYGSSSHHSSHDSSSYDSGSSSSGSDSSW
ncbi:hypothetical protein [Pantoea ananatis]|uniref:hypothetical protein n=1 Tax=Pantoea ananas TaxID=553 RepID=UPI003C14635F